ncbi:MAG: hypothetical protein R2713_09290 [Ilumatobacteraceae bacterium]
MECGLHEVIDALAGADLGVLDDGGLHAAVVGLGRELDRLQIVLARHAREWASRGIHEQDGSKSAAARLARESHCGVDTAREVIGRGRGLDHLGSTVAAVMDGRLSVDHLDLFARVNTPARRALFARDEQMLIDQCAGLFFFQAVRRCQMVCVRGPGLFPEGRTHCGYGQSRSGTRGAPPATERDRGLVEVVGCAR